MSMTVSEQSLSFKPPSLACTLQLLPEHEKVIEYRAKLPDHALAPEITEEVHKADLFVEDQEEIQREEKEAARKRKYDPDCKPAKE